MSRPVAVGRRVSWPDAVEPSRSRHIVERRKIKEPRTMPGLPLVDFFASNVQLWSTMVRFGSSSKTSASIAHDRPQPRRWPVTRAASNGMGRASRLDRDAVEGVDVESSASVVSRIASGSCRVAARAKLADPTVGEPLLTFLTITIHPPLERPHRRPQDLRCLRLRDLTFLLADPTN